MTKSVLGKELKKKLIQGIKEISEPVIATLGPSGRNVMIKNDDGTIKITKDGVTVANAFKKLEDPVKDFAVQLVKQVSRNSAKKVGDGTTTSTLLTYKMALEGLEVIKDNTNVVDVKKGIDSATGNVVEYLKMLSKDIVSEEQLKHVATISANNDESIGILVSQALFKVGRDGVAILEESKTGETYLDVVEGIMFKRGYKSPFLVTDNSRMEAVLKNPFVFLYDGVVSTAKQLIPLFEYVTSNDNKPVIIIAEDIVDEALATIIVNKMRNIVKIVAVRAPEFGEKRSHFLEDIAVITGGEVLSSSKGDNLEKIKSYEGYLGKCKSVNVTRDETTIVDGAGNPDKIKERLLDIKNQIDNSKSDYEREKLQERVGKLVGGVAIIYVGGLSDVELKEKKDRVEDALFATKAAIDYGVLPGGGKAYLNAYKKLFSEDIYLNSDQEIGRQIVLNALKTPFKTMILNAGIHDGVDELTESIIQLDDWQGYNIKTFMSSDLETEGILDSTKVVITAIENAASVAGIILTTEAAVYEEKEEDINQDVDYSKFGI